MGLDANRVGGNVRELKPARRGRPLRLLVRLLVVMFLASAGTYYGWNKYGEAELGRELERYRAESEPITVAEFEDQAALPPDQNAALDLIAAADRLQEDPKEYWATSDADSMLPLDDEQMVLVAGLIRRCPDVWERLAAAERKPVARWDGAGLDNSVTRGNLPWHVRRLATFLQIAARHFHQLGDDRRAMGCVRQILSVAAALGQAAEGDGVAGDCERMAAHAALQLAPELDLASDRHTMADHADVRAIIDRLLDDRAMRTSMVRSLKLRRAKDLDRLRAFADGRSNLSGGPPGDRECWVRDRLLRPMALVDAAILLRQADRVIAAAGAAPDLPTFRSLAPDLGDPREAQGFPALHLIANGCGPRYDRWLGFYFRAIAERHLAATALAVRYFAAAHGGVLPQTLDALVPEILRAVPADPMVVEGRMRYRPEGTDRVLYGVGEDGQDDGGSEQPIDAARELSTGWDRLTETRDMVVHLRNGPVGPRP